MVSLNNYMFVNPYYPPSLRLQIHRDEQRVFRACQNLRTGNPLMREHIEGSYS